MQLFVKNMVCDRCIMVVKAELEQFGLHPDSVSLGVAELQEAELSQQQLKAINDRFLQIGFELLDDKKRKILEQVKTTIIELIHSHNDDTPIKHSEYIAQRVGRDYPFLSKLFSEAERVTIEQYLILQRIEKVKELLAYGELNLSEISWQLGYSSVAALSSQFKKVTGITPSAYKDLEQKDRKTLDQVGR
jgi:AraC family transcriptional regulator